MVFFFLTKSQFFKCLSESFIFPHLIDFKFSLHTTKSSFCILITLPTFFYISDSFCFSFYQLKNSLCQSIIDPSSYIASHFFFGGGGLIHPHSDHFWSSKVLRMCDSYLDNYVSGTFS